MYLTKDNVLNLCNAVIIQAVEDYRKALVKQHKYRNVTQEVDVDIWIAKLSADSEVEELERFFREHGQNWTTLDTEILMKQVKDEVIMYDYNLKKLKDDHTMYSSKNNDICEEEDE